MDCKEQNKAFLAFFWDLALDDKTKRLAAAEGILEHVAESIKTQKGMNEDKTMTIDLDYALKRLVRGLASSRDSARHGFATCLSKLLSSRCVDASLVLKIMEDNTKITGKMKGSEERDLMFGKLFGYLTMVRSGLLQDQTELSMEILAKLLELHKRRKWLREVVSEAILVVLWAIPVEVVEEKVLPLLANTDTDGTIGIGSYWTGTNLALPSTSLEHYEPWQLLMSIGLQRYMSEHGDDNKKLKKQIHALMPEDLKKVCTTDTFPRLHNALLGATSGFPKIHRVWDYVLGQVYGMEGPERLLPSKRVAKLSSKQSALLHAFVSFVEVHLMPASHERRSLAYRLTVTLARLSPASFMPLVLSPIVMKGLTSARSNPKHLLSRLASRTLLDLVEAVQDNTACRLLMASTLVQFAGGSGQNFDAFSVKMLTNLTTGLGAEDVVSHITSLVKVVSKTRHYIGNGGSGRAEALAARKDGKAKSKKSKKTNKRADDDTMAVEEGEGEEEEEEVDRQRSDELAACAAVDALGALLKNASLAQRGNAARLVVAALARVSCIGSGISAVATSEIAKKSARRTRSSSVTSDTEKPMGLPSDCVAIIKCVEGHLSDEEKEEFDLGAPGVTRFPADVVSAASSKLLGVLGDLGTVPIGQLNSAAAEAGGIQGDEVQKDSVTSDDAQPLVLFAVDCVSAMLSSGVALLAKGSVTVPGGLILDQVDEENGALTSLTQAVTSLNSLKGLKLASNADKVEKAEKLGPLLAQLLGQATMMMVSGTHDVSSSVGELGSSLPSLAALQDTSPEKKKKASKKRKAEAADDHDPDEDERRVECLSSLLDISLELVSYTGDANVTAKGVRDAVRRVWGAVGRDVPVSLGLLESVVEAVIADDIEEEEDEEEDEEAIEEENAKNDEENDLSNDEEDDDGQSESKSKGKGKKRRMEAESESASASEEEGASKGDEDDDGEKDELIDPDAALDLLAEEESDSDEELERLKGMVEHGQEADAALVNMLEQRKQGRKAGLLLAKRKQCVIRSRALDILESLLNRVDSAELLVPLLPPLLVCVRKLQTGLIQNLHEGRAFEERLRTYIEGKFCKKRFTLLAEGDVEVEEGVLELVQGLCISLSADATSAASLPLRRMAESVLLSLTRAVLGGDVETAKETLGHCYSALCRLYFTKKNSRVNSQLFDEVTARFPEFSATHLLEEFVCAVGNDDTKGPFLRAEGCRLTTLVLRRYSSLTANAQNKVQAIVGIAFHSLAIFLSSLQQSPTAANKRVKPVLQCVKELASLPCCANSAATLRSLAGASSAEKSKKKAKKSKNAAAPAPVTSAPNFDAAAAKLIAAVQVESKRSSEGNSRSLAGLCLDALKQMGLEIGSPASGSGASSEESHKGKKRKKLSQLEEDELRVVSKQPGDSPEGGEEGEGRGGDLEKSKWFDLDQKQQRRPKKKKTS